MVTVNIGAPGGDVDINFTRLGSVGLLDAVYIISSNTIDRADASTPSPNAAIGFVSALTGPTTADVRTEKTLGGFTGLTPGLPLYLDTTPGAITHTPPLGLGEIHQEVAVAVSPTTILIKIDTDPTVNS